MADLDAEELEDPRLRLNMRPWMVAAVLNLALGAVILGIPYFRGPSRAREVLPRFARFTACLYEAEAAPSPGLALPEGDRARYASLVIGADGDWPERCREDLRAIPPEESRFLFPAVKSAEAQLRDTTAALDRELAALGRARARGDSRVPDRPMRAMANLRAALAELGISASVSSLSAEREAIVIDTAAHLPVPSIVPLRVADTGPWFMRVEDGALVAAGVDERRVGYARVEGGRVDVRLTRRTRLVSELVEAGEGEPPWAVLTTPARRCAEHACVDQATGLAALLEDQQRLEPMVWLRGHPAAPGAVRVRGRTAWMLAETVEGSELRRFELPEPRVRALGEEREVPRIEPTARQAARALAPGARLAWRTDGTLVVATETDADGSGRVFTARLESDPGALEPEPIERWGPLLLTAGARWTAYGDPTRVRVQGDRGPFVSCSIAIRPPTPRALRLLRAETSRPELWGLGDRTLQRCRPSPAGQGAEWVVAGGGEEAPVRDVAAFDVAPLGERTVVAWADDVSEGAVHIAVFDAAGREVSRAIPAACWHDPVDGLCGAPRLASDGSTVMLVTRDDSDLRVLRSNDGERWEALAGL